MKISKIEVKKVFLAAALAWSGIAGATPYQFILTGDSSAQWILDSAPKPNSRDIGDTFSLYRVNGTFLGESRGVASMIFYSSKNSGGLEISIPNGNFLLTDGPQLYTGLESSPVFKLGTFSLTGSWDPSKHYTLAVTEAIAAVPEPETYAMLLAGLGLMGFVARRRKQA